MDLKLALEQSKWIERIKASKKEPQVSVNIDQYLFEFSPISIWEEDFSEAKVFIDDLASQGVNDFRTHFEENEDDIFIISGLIKVLNINQETLKMFGVKTKEEIPLNLPKYFTKDSLPVFKEEILAFIDGETIFESSIPIVSLEGVPMILDIKAQILPGYEDTWEKVLVSFVDVTKQKAAEAALLKREQELRESNLAKDKLFSIIAHDLKSPMNAILGFSELLKDQDDKMDASQRNNMLDYIHISAKNSYGLFENLLTWSRSQVGSISYTPKKEILSQIVNDNISLFRQIAESKQVTIVSEIPDNLEVCIDSNMISTIFRNLIYNAIKFTPKKGDIMITIENEGSDHDGFIEVVISDSGVGIPEEKVSQLFKLGETKSTKGTNREQGTGLGLILCKDFVEKHGGAIWIESKIDHGTRVHFTIPTEKS